MPEQLFQIANLTALAGWAALLVSPIRPGLERIVGIVVPGMLAVLYTALILGFWMRGEGGFGSLAEVARLFQTPELLLAGWVHYLAFDLFVGCWIVARAREAGMAFILVVPVLAATFLFGPAGFLFFLALCAGRRVGAPVKTF